MVAASRRRATPDERRVRLHVCGGGLRLATSLRPRARRRLMSLRRRVFFRPAAPQPRAPRPPKHSGSDEERIGCLFAHRPVSLAVHCCWLASSVDGCRRRGLYFTGPHTVIKITRYSIRGLYWRRVGSKQVTHPAKACLIPSVNANENTEKACDAETKVQQFGTLGIPRCVKTQCLCYAI